MKLKKIGRLFVCTILEFQVRRLIKKNDFKRIAIVGSVGKTSTKLATAKLLSIKQKVIFQDGNYNDRATVPLVLFNKTAPNILNVWSWLKIFIDNEKQLKKSYPYDIALIELGPDGPNQLKDFSYLKPNLTVLTAIASEHMELFKTLDNVAKEELVPLSYSDGALINIDDVPSQYLPKTDFKSYGSSTEADFKLVETSAKGIEKQTLKVNLAGNEISFDTKLLGNQGAKITLAAASVATILGWSTSDIKKGLSGLSPASGRMQILKGVNGSVIIDDTYNASPLAVKAALDVLYSLDYPKKIAVLGSMNELGQVSQDEHRSIGAYCDPAKLELLITVGAEAEKFLAPSASIAGVKVKSFLSPYEAGRYLKTVVESNTVILAKGSQNGVFTEEAIKQILAAKEDEAKLVRQSKDWLEIKAKQFKPQA